LSPKIGQISLHYSSSSCNAESTSSCRYKVQVMSVLSLNTAPHGCIGDMEVTMHSRPRPYIEMSGQLHAPATLPPRQKPSGYWSGTKRGSMDLRVVPNVTKATF